MESKAASGGLSRQYHSFVACLGAALVAKGQPVDPTELMGATSWAFRITVHKELCPSAMSVFDMTTVLTESAAQMGYHCRYISRYWHEAEFEEARRLEAQQAIITAVDAGDVAIVWDINIPEWGLITGYDAKAQIYQTLDCDNQPGELPFARLGQGAVPILSVTILTEPNGRSQAERQRRALELAVAHARHQQWLDRGDYQDGSEAFALWADAIEATDPDLVHWDFAGYYARHYFSARADACDYVRRLAGENEALQQAADAYEQAAQHLYAVCIESDDPELQDDPVMRAMVADRLREAGRWDALAVGHIERYLAESAG